MFHLKQKTVYKRKIFSKEQKSHDDRKAISMPDLPSLQIKKMFDLSKACRWIEGYNPADTEDILLFKKNISFSFQSVFGFYN